MADSLAPTRAVDRALGLLTATADAPLTLTELAGGAITSTSCWEGQHADDDAISGCWD